MNRYQVSGEIYILMPVSEVVDAESEDSAFDKVIELYNTKYPDASYVDWDNGEDSEEPEAIELGLVPEDQMMLKLPAEIAPQLPGFDRDRRAA